MCFLRSCFCVTSSTSRQSKILTKTTPSTLHSITATLIISIGYNLLYYMLRRILPHSLVATSVASLRVQLRLPTPLDICRRHNAPKSPTSTICKSSSTSIPQDVLC